MLIFDRFLTTAKAEEFADYCRENFGRTVWVVRDSDELGDTEFPCQMFFPLVMVSEQQPIEDLAVRYVGSFTGGFVGAKVT
jgi:hypothetical protein